MSDTIAPAEVSVSVSPRGEAVVFVTRPAGGRPQLLNPARFVAAFAARGLRLVGLSSSTRPASAVCPRTRSAAVGSRSLLDAALSLVDEPRTALV